MSLGSIWTYVKIATISVVVQLFAIVLGGDFSWRWPWVIFCSQTAFSVYAARWRYGGAHTGFICDTGWHPVSALRLYLGNGSQAQVRRARHHCASFGAFRCSTGGVYCLQSNKVRSLIPLDEREECRRIQKLGSRINVVNGIRLD